MHVKAILDVDMVAKGARVSSRPLHNRLLNREDSPMNLDELEKMTVEKIAAWASQQTVWVDFKNTKSEVADIRIYSFNKSLNKVWSAMHEVEDVKARVRN